MPGSQRLPDDLRSMPSTLRRKRPFPWLYLRRHSFVRVSSDVTQPSIGIKLTGLDKVIDSIKFSVSPLLTDQSTVAMRNANSLVFARSLLSLIRSRACFKVSLLRRTRFFVWAMLIVRCPFELRIYKTHSSGEASEMRKEDPSWSNHTRRRVLHHSFLLLECRADEKGPHVHSNTNSFHYCEQRCPSCK